MKYFCFKILLLNAVFHFRPENVDLPGPSTVPETVSLECMERWSSSKTETASETGELFSETFQVPLSREKSRKRFVLSFL